MATSRPSEVARPWQEIREALEAAIRAGDAVAEAYWSATRQPHGSRPLLDAWDATKVAALARLSELEGSRAGREEGPPKPHQTCPLCKRKPRRTLCGNCGRHYWNEAGHDCEREVVPGPPPPAPSGEEPER